MNERTFCKSRLVLICCFLLSILGVLGCERTHSQDINWLPGSRVQFREHVEMHDIDGQIHQIASGSVARLQRIVNETAHVVLFDVIGSTSIENLELAENVVQRAFSELESPLPRFPRESTEHIDVGVVGGFLNRGDWPQDFVVKRKKLHDDIVFIEHAYRIATDQKRIEEEQEIPAAMGEQPLNDCRNAYLSALSNPKQGLEKVNAFCDQHPQNAQALIWRMIIQLIVIADSSDASEAPLESLQTDYNALESLNAMVSLPAMIMSMAELKTFELRIRSQDLTATSLANEACLKKAREYYQIARSFDKYDPMLDELEVSLRRKELLIAEAGSDPENVANLQLTLYRDLLTMIEEHPYRKGFLQEAFSLEDRGVHTLKPADEVVGDTQQYSEFPRLIWGRTAHLYNQLTEINMSTDQFRFRNNPRRAMPRLPGQPRWQVNTAPSILRNSEEPWTSLLPRPLDGWQVLPAAYGCLHHTMPLDYQSAHYVQQQEFPNALFMLQLPTLTLDLQATDDQGVAVFHAFKNNPTLWALIANEHIARVKAGQTSLGIDFDYEPRRPDSVEVIEDDFLQEQRQIGKRIKDRLIAQSKLESAQGEQARSILLRMKKQSRLRLNKLQGATLGESIVVYGSQFQRYTAFAMGYKPSDEYLEALCHDYSVKLDPNLSLVEQWRPIAVEEVKQGLEQAYQSYKTSLNLQAAKPSSESIIGHRQYLDNLGKMRVGGSSRYMRALEGNYYADIRAGRDVDPIARYESDKRAIQSQQLNRQHALKTKMLHMPAISSFIGGDEGDDLMNRSKEMYAELN